MPCGYSIMKDWKYPFTEAQIKKVDAKVIDWLCRVNPWNNDKEVMGF